jgi:hypothetical protein
LVFKRRADGGLLRYYDYVGLKRPHSAALQLRMESIASTSIFKVKMLLSTLLNPCPYLAVLFVRLDSNE